MSVRTVWYVHPYAGGPGVGRMQRAWYLAARWRAAGIDTHVFTGANHHVLDEPRAPGSTFDTEACRFHFLGLPAYAGNGVRRLLNMLAFGPALRRYVSRHRVPTPDVIVYSSPHLFGARAARRLARHYGAQFVFEVRDLWPLSLTELGGTSPGHPVVRYLAVLERDAYRRADAVVSVLPGSRMHMQAHGLTPSHWHYVPNGVEPIAGSLASPGSAVPPSDTVDDESMDDELLVWMGVRRRAGKRVLIYAGTFGVPNGLHRLLEALASLEPAVRERLQLLLVGDGTECARLQEMALGLPCRIHPSIPKSRVWRVLRAADGGFISLAPSSVFRFGISPNKLFDYMVAGLPVISAIAAGNDPVAEAKAGWSVAPDDVPALARTLSRFVEAPAARLAAHGTNGHRWAVAHHGYERLAGTYLGLFEGLTASSESLPQPDTAPSVASDGTQAIRVDAGRAMRTAAREDASVE